ncbi:MAG: DUF4402 domain-containing protein [Sediminibacterium sp.]
MIKEITILIILFLSATILDAQPPQPPRPIAVFVNPAQGLIFGTFFRGNTGGSVIIYPDGSRSVTGDIVQSNIGVPFSPAIFEVEASQGTIITILNGPDIKLNGSNGGTVNLHIGTASSGSPFITSVSYPSRTTIRVGGTLSVGGPLTSPSGSYSGVFYVTFIHQ